MEDESPDKLVRFLKITTHEIKNVFQNTTAIQKQKLNKRKYYRFRRSQKKGNDEVKCFIKKRQYLEQQYNIQNMYTSMLHAVPMFTSEMQSPYQETHRPKFVKGIEMGIEIPTTAQFLNNYIPSFESPRENQALSCELYDIQRYPTSSYQECVYAGWNQVNTGNNRVGEDDDFMVSQMNTCGDIGRFASEDKGNCGAIRGNQVMPKLNLCGALDINSPKRGASPELVNLEISNVENNDNGATNWEHSAVPGTVATSEHDPGIVVDHTTTENRTKLLPSFQDDNFSADAAEEIFSEIEDGSSSMEEELEPSSDSGYFGDVDVSSDEFSVSNNCYDWDPSSSDLQTFVNGGLLSKLPSFSSIFL